MKKRLAYHTQEDFFRSGRGEKEEGGPLSLSHREFGLFPGQISIVIIIINKK